MIKLEHMSGQGMTRIIHVPPIQLLIENCWFSWKFFYLSKLFNPHWMLQTLHTWKM